MSLVIVRSCCNRYAKVQDGSVVRKRIRAASPHPFTEVDFEGCCIGSTFHHKSIWYGNALYLLCKISAEPTSKRPSLRLSLVRIIQKAFIKVFHPSYVFKINKDCFEKREFWVLLIAQLGLKKKLVERKKALSVLSNAVANTWAVTKGNDGFESDLGTSNYPQTFKQFLKGWLWLPWYGRSQMLVDVHHLLHYEDSLLELHVSPLYFALRSPFMSNTPMIVRVVSAAFFQVWVYKAKRYDFLDLRVPTLTSQKQWYCY